MRVNLGGDVRQWLTSAIPEIPSVDGRKSVTIIECGEPFALLDRFSPDFIAVRPEYALRGYRNATTRAFARLRVAEMLLGAARLLPPPHRLMIWDAWRPTALQEEIFVRYRTTIHQQHPEYDGERLTRETEAYVSIPSRDPSAPAPHSTGGAIDLTICNGAGQALETGTDFDHFGPQAAARYYEEKVERGQMLSGAEAQALANRRLLYHIMTRQGFTSYREEWWHFDFGDQFWGRISGNPSIYSGRESVG